MRPGRVELSMSRPLVAVTIQPYWRRSRGVRSWWAVATLRPLVGGRIAMWAPQPGERAARPLVRSPAAGAGAVF